MSSMVTPPPTDRRMWRILLRTVHPDTSGTHELFVWVKALYEHVAGENVGDSYATRTARNRRQPPEHPQAGERVPFHARVDSFTDLTRRAVAMAHEVGEPYASVLWLLDDCDEVGPSEDVYKQQQSGATYKTLAAIAYAAGMSAGDRYQWYKVAESIPLSQRHAGHILMHLKKAA